MSTKENEVYLVFCEVFKTWKTLFSRNISIKCNRTKKKYLLNSTKKHKMSCSWKWACFNRSFPGELEGIAEVKKAFWPKYKRLQHEMQGCVLQGIRIIEESFELFENVWNIFICSSQSAYSRARTDSQPDCSSAVRVNSRSTIIYGPLFCWLAWHFGLVLQAKRERWAPLDLCFLKGLF